MSGRKTMKEEEEDGDNLKMSVKKEKHTIWKQTGCPSNSIVFSLKSTPIVLMKVSWNTLLSYRNNKEDFPTEGSPSINNLKVRLPCVSSLICIELSCFLLENKKPIPIH
eukprot:TRINITY_DN10713_c0_g1_i5.p2 TRINITY_DN10713_c0_g1~~TRINITY_DN10713_c0_g1_i5.p2  ORF type:complete len:109 (+),score=22.73 TRINITY_DN10713_c0_g1_i5:498-824(+)